MSVPVQPILDIIDEYFDNAQGRANMRADYREAIPRTIECTICRREVPVDEYYREHIDSHPCE